MMIPKHGASLFPVDRFKGHDLWDTNIRIVASISVLNSLGGEATIIAQACLKTILLFSVVYVTGKKHFVLVFF